MLLGQPQSFEHHIGKIFKLIPKVMGSINPVAKGEVNKFQNYKYRGIEQLYNAIHPALVEHGVFCVPQVLNSQTQEIEAVDKDGKTKHSYRVLLTVSHKFYAEDASFVDVITIGEGIDQSDKATNKAMSAAMKYAFIELFSIPTEDIVLDSEKDEPPAGKIAAPKLTNVTTVSGGLKNGF